MEAVSLKLWNRGIFRTRQGSGPGNKAPVRPDRLARQLAAAETRFFNIISRTADSILIVDPEVR
jgi:hypothetical protein